MSNALPWAALAAVVAYFYARNKVPAAPAPTPAKTIAQLPRPTGSQPAPITVAPAGPAVVSIAPTRPPAPATSSTAYAFVHSPSGATKNVTPQQAYNVNRANTGQFYSPKDSAAQTAYNAHVRWATAPIA